MYKKNFILTIVLLFAFVSEVLAQERVHWDAVAKIRDEGFKRSQVMEIASYLTDVYGPRLAGSPSYMEAAEWAKKKFEEMGMRNVALEEWGEFGLGWANKYTSVHMHSPQYMPIIAYPRAWTRGTDGKIMGKAVFINTSEIYTEADLEQYRGKLRNAIVLTSPKRTMRPSFEPEAKRHTNETLETLAKTNLGGGGGEISISREQYFDLVRRARSGERPQRRLDSDILNKFFEDEGVSVKIAPGSGDDGTVYVYGGVVKTKDAPKPMASLSIAGEHYNRILRILEKGIDVEMEVEVRTEFTENDLKDYNVIAEIPGTDLRDEVVMLGGHFDATSAGTGATDNAAGSAVVMEAMRILKATGLQPRRTIRAALWGAEEEGLFGSRGYVHKHFAKVSGRYNNITVDEILSGHAKLAGYFNMDNGTGKFRGVYLQGNELVRPIFTEWMKPFHDLEMTHLTPRNTGGTDHLYFDWVGLPGFQFIQDQIEYGSRTHHSNMDVYDRLIKEDLMQNAVIMASFVYHTAMRDEKLPRKPLPNVRGK